MFVDEVGIKRLRQEDIWRMYLTYLKGRTDAGARESTRAYFRMKAIEFNPIIERLLKRERDRARKMPTVKRG